MGSVIDCLDQANRLGSLQGSFDCMANAILVRDAWITQQIAKCKVVK